MDLSRFDLSKIKSSGCDIFIALQDLIVFLKAKEVTDPELSCLITKAESVINSLEKNKPVNIPFDVFWDLYDKKIDKEKCLKKWMKLTDLERNDCMQALPSYIKSTTDKLYRKNPYTYLHNKSWTNEIIKKDEGTKTGNTRIVKRVNDYWDKKA